MTASTPLAYTVANVAALIARDVSSAEQTVLRAACAASLLGHKLNTDDAASFAWDDMMEGLLHKTTLSLPSQRMVAKGGWAILRDSGTQRAIAMAYKAHGDDVAMGASHLANMLLARHKSAAKVWLALGVDKAPGKKLKVKPEAAAPEAAAPEAAAPEAAAPITMQDRIDALVTSINVLEANDVSEKQAARLLEVSRELLARVTRLVFDSAAAKEAAKASKEAAKAAKEAAKRITSLADIGAAMVA